MRKLYLLYFLILFIIINCANDNNYLEKHDSIDNYMISKNKTIYSLIDTLQAHDLSIIKEVVSPSLADKVKKEELNLQLTFNDTIPLKILNLDGNDFNFTIKDTINSAYNVHISKAIPKGGSIYQTLTDLGMKPKDIGYYAWKMGEFIEATTIDIGDIFAVQYTLDSLNVKTIEKFSYQPDKTSIHEFTLLADRELSYKLVELPYELKRRYLEGEISKEFSTLDAAMNELGIIPYIRQQANNALESQIAFSTDARIGDKFKVYIEEKYFEGEVQQEGKMLFVEYSGKYAKNKSAFRFEDDKKASAFTGMYTAKGKRLVSNAVRTPLDRMHITSPFGYRIHPILGKRKMHNGIDLRGSRGTPVYAITSGKVISAGTNGGYGKEVRVRHSNGMVSQYAHLSRINTRRNRNVKKGQIIGRVGSTGRSTGPHLHFGIMKGRRWVNPRTNIRMVGANKLKGKRLEFFKKQMETFKSEMSQKISVAVISDSLKTS